MSNSWRDKTKGLISEIVPVGSRVTCNPPPTDTDEDFLVLVLAPKWSEFTRTMESLEFERGGSDIPDEANQTAPADRFTAFRCNDVNLIVTHSEPFFRRFLAATHVAKRLNLLSKEDRIVLFQAVLYGNIREPLPAIDLPSLETEIAF